MTVPMKTPATGDVMESVLLKGDIAKLDGNERVQYYKEVCKSMGLNPLTKPFEFITLNGKLQLYALRSCTDQLRKIDGVSLQIVSKEVSDDILTVHVRATNASGRTDEDLGAVSFPPTLKGEARANAELKAVTKAKRRATLSICGLGWLDETEIDDIPVSAKRPAPPAPNVMLPPHDRATGEVIESSSPTTMPAASSPTPPPEGEAAGTSSEERDIWNKALAKASERGLEVLSAAWRTVPRKIQPHLKDDLNNVHKPYALTVDRELEAEERT